jgi:hypothetical protein
VVKILRNIPFNSSKRISTVKCHLYIPLRLLLHRDNVTVTSLLPALRDKKKTCLACVLAGRMPRWWSGRARWPNRFAWAATRSFLPPDITSAITNWYTLDLCNYLVIAVFFVFFFLENRKSVLELVICSRFKSHSSSNMKGHYPYGEFLWWLSCIIKLLIVSPSDWHHICGWVQVCAVQLAGVQHQVPGLSATPARVQGHPGRRQQDQSGGLRTGMGSSCTYCQPALFAKNIDGP